MKKKSSKISKILRFFCIGVFCFSVSAWAILPVVYYAAAALAGAAFFTFTVTGQNAARSIQLFGKRVASFQLHTGQSIISSDAYAIPNGTKTGVPLKLETPKSAVQNQLKNNPSQYPQVAQAIRDTATPPQGMTQGSWGVGADQFDASQLPQVGDIVALSDGTNVRVNSVANQCHNLGYSRTVGHSQTRNNNRLLDVWTGCNGISSAGTSGSGITYSISPVTGGTADDLTPEQWDQILASHPDEVSQAQRDLYNSANGHSGSGSGSASLPGNSSTGQLVVPGTSRAPTADEIIQATDTADAIAHPDQDNPPPATSTTTTTTREQGQATVSVDPQTGARTITIPTTVTVTDAAGNIISQQTEYFVGTYPANATLPADVAAAMEGAVDATTGEKVETATPPMNLTKPELAEVNLDPLFKAADIMHNKFPFALLATVTDFLNSWYVEPQIPQFDMIIAGEEFTVSLELLDNFAFWWRRFLRLIAIALAAYYALRICFM